MKIKIYKAENGWVISPKFSPEDQPEITVIENKNDNEDDSDVYSLVKELPHILGASGGKRTMNIRTIFIPGHDYSSQINEDALRTLLDTFFDIGHALVAHEAAGGDLNTTDIWVDMDKIKSMLAILKTEENDGTI